jgi:SARP family transcriptional regulator, regulator of embCAB operon
MRVEVKVLGPLEAFVEGRSIVPSARKERQVLALLALNAAKVVPFSMLIEEIWGDSPPRVPAASLQTYILHLRQRLGRGKASSGKDILLTVPGGYVLDIPATNVDACRYERLVATGRGAVNVGDYPTATEELAAGLQEWRGEALLDVAVGPQLQIERTRLEESRLSVLDLRIDLDLRLGRHRLILDELATICARHPWYENFHAHYMLALYRSGLAWRALEVYRVLRTTVSKQLGVDPSPYVRQLHQAILAGDRVIDDPRFAASDWITRSTA